MQIRGQPGPARRMHAMTHARDDGLPDGNADGAPEGSAASMSDPRVCVHDATEAHRINPNVAVLVAISLSGIAACRPIKGV